jgi:CheY-like chemotaxis protein
LVAEFTTSGESAVDMVCEHHERHDDYQIVLIDWKMPGIDGIETARRIRRKVGADVPILLISAYDWTDIEDEAREAGVNGFIAKPLFKSTLFHGLKPFTESADLYKTVEIDDGSVDLSGKHVIIAEDNDLNWEIANELLSSLGLILDHAENGKVCTEMFNKSPIGYYSAILMDLRMPVMTGYEATEAIRNLDREDSNVPIIAMTADAFSEDIQRCLQHGMNAHIAKPINIRETARLLKKYIN